MQTVDSFDPDRTRALGQGLAGQLRPGDVLALIGEMGSGKTTFVQGLASGMGIALGEVASPSFVLVREYRGRFPMAHADLFRLNDSWQAQALGLEAYYGTEWVTVIEWADRAPQILPEEYLEIRFEVIAEDTRRLTLIPYGKRYESMRWIV
jgi:tRNA threonylcarbamoyladenosine biosynthesis protein TsaE